ISGCLFWTASSCSRSCATSGPEPLWCCSPATPRWRWKRDASRWVRPTTSPSRSKIRPCWPASARRSVVTTRGLRDGLLPAGLFPRPLKHRPDELRPPLALPAIQQPRGHRPARVTEDLVAKGRPLPVGTRLDQPAPADGLHADVILVRGRADIVGRGEGDLVALRLGIDVLLEPHRVITVSGQGDRQLLVGPSLVARLGQEIEPLEVGHELDVFPLPPDGLENRRWRQRALR